MSRYYPPVTVTGNPVNFSAPNGGKLDSVSVPIIPTQDLHGYANPWPAGGGENILPMPITSGSYANSVTVAVNPDLSFVINKPNGNGWTVFQLGSFSLAAGTYTLIEADDGNQNASISILHEDNTEITNTRYVKRRVFTITSSETVKATYSRAAAATDVLSKIMLFAGDTKTADDYAPYSNICPISGLTGLSVYVSPTQDQDDDTVYNVDWTTQAGTVYHGTVDVVSGELTVDMVNIPSYNGETITEPWLSSMDAYAAGTTPTIGAQVVYTLADPAVYQLGHKFLTVLSGENYVWASNNETISVVYALLVPGSDKYTLIVNGVDIADFVERDSYRTTLYPVFSEAVQTLDGVGHTALLRKKGELSARFNPRTAADTAIICAALLNAPCEVQYHCLQRNADVTALMTIDSVSALYLSRCLYCRQKWNDIDSITLTEL